MSLCECGCGQEVKPGNRFVRGHNGRVNNPMKGKKHKDESLTKMSEAHKGKICSEETRQKMSLAHKGQAPWIKGRRHSDETRLRMSIAQKKSYNPERLEKVRVAWQGDRNCMRRPEVAEKNAAAKRGRPMSEDQKKILSDRTRTWLADPRNHPMYGKEHTEESKDKMRGDRNPAKRPEVAAKISSALKGKLVREKNPNWNGGSSFEPYGLEFDSDLKLRIRQRDNFTCRKCGDPENGGKLCIHHVDYNKKNNNDSNLIALCRSCNGLVNSNREHWQVYFREVHFGG